VESDLDRKGGKPSITIPAGSRSVLTARQEGLLRVDRSAGALGAVHRLDHLYRRANGRVFLVHDLGEHGEPEGRGRHHDELGH
jgi:hypothetical protein